MAKSKKGFGNLVKAGFEEKITVRTKGRRKRVERLEVIVLQQVMQAVRGERSALKFVLKHLAEIKVPARPSPKMQYRHPDGSREIHYGGTGKVKYVAPDGAVTMYRDRDEYYSQVRHSS